MLRGFTPRYEAAFAAGLARKLGLDGAPEADAAVLGEEWLALLAAARADFTASFRALSAVLRGAEHPLTAGAHAERAQAWLGRWRAALAAAGAEPAATAAALDAANPVYIPRNHLVEAALTAATAGDLGPFSELLDVVGRPFEARPGLEAWAAPGPEDARPYRTFCGT